MTDLAIEDALSMLKSTKFLLVDVRSDDAKRAADLQAFLIRTLEEHARVMKDTTRLDSRQITLIWRDDFGEMTAHRHCDIDLRAAIDAQITKEQA